MIKIEVYSTAQCPYCVRAKQLLEQRGLDYNEIRIDQDMSKRQEMLARCDGRRTVPQIIINEQAIGGFQELWELQRTGELDRLLEQK